VVSLGSPVTVVDRPPTAFKKSVADEWVVLWVSNARGWKMWVAGRLAYLEVFLLTAASTSRLGWHVDIRVCQCADYRDVPSQRLTSLPRSHGKSIRAPAVSSCQVHGSFITETLAVVGDHAMTSLIAWCLVILLGTCLQTEPWRTRVSSGDAQYGRHRRCNQDAKRLPHGLRRQKVSVHSQRWAVLKASLRCEVWQRQGSWLSAVAQNSAQTSQIVWKCISDTGHKENEKASCETVYIPALNSGVAEQQRSPSPSLRPSYWQAIASVWLTAAYRHPVLDQRVVWFPASPCWTASWLTLVVALKICAHAQQAFSFVQSLQPTAGVQEPRAWAGWLC